MFLKIKTIKFLIAVLAVGLPLVSNTFAQSFWLDQNPLPNWNKNSEVATWSAARVGGAPLMDFCKPNCLDFLKTLERVRQATPEIVRRKGYTSFAVASCVNRICAAILHNERTILPVSTMTCGQYGIDGIYMSLPCVVGRDGVEKIVEVPLDDAEREGLLASADLLKRTLAELKNQAGLPAIN